MRFPEFREKYIFDFRRHALWGHPWFTLVRDHRSKRLLGRLVRHWTLEAGLIEVIIPDLIETLLANPNISPTIHPSLRENLGDERGNGRLEDDHMILYSHVLSAAAISDEEFIGTEAYDGTKVLRGNLLEATNRGAIEALSVMTTEELLPGIGGEFPPVRDAFEQLGDPNGSWRRYFDVHCAVDDKHSGELMQALYEACDENEQLERQAFAFRDRELDWNAKFHDSVLRMAYQ